MARCGTLPHPFPLPRPRPRHPHPRESNPNAGGKTKGRADSGDPPSAALPLLLLLSISLSLSLGPGLGHRAARMLLVTSAATRRAGALVAPGCWRRTGWGAVHFSSHTAAGRLGPAMWARAARMRQPLPAVHPARAHTGRSSASPRHARREFLSGRAISSAPSSLPARRPSPPSSPHSHSSSSPCSCSCSSSMASAAAAASEDRRGSGRSSSGPKEARERRGGGGGGTAVDPADRRYWEEVLSGVDRPSARALVQFVNLSYPLGIETFENDADADAGAKEEEEEGEEEGDSLATRTKASSSSSSKVGRKKNAKKKQSQGKRRVPALHRDFVRWKNDRPRHVILARVGEFYECQGVDAILLVQFAGLNPMGNPSNPPRAGCPKQNIQRTLDDLTSNGLSVAVYEEKGTISKRPPSASTRKTRFLAQVVSPGFPNYLYGRIDTNEADAYAEAYRTPTPIVGVARSVSGCSLLCLRADERRMLVSEGLTEDAVELFFRTHRPSEVLLHRPAGASSGLAGSKEARWEAKMRRAFQQLHGIRDVRTFTSADALEGFASRVRTDLGMPADAEFRVVREEGGGGGGKGELRRDQRRPVVADSTASNLGLYPTRGIVPLASTLTGPGAPSACKAYLLSMLLSPPPRRVALDVNAALGMMLRADPTAQSVPVQYLIPAGKIQSLLYAQEASDGFFRELRLMLRGVLALVKEGRGGDWPHALASRLLPLVRLNTGESDITLRRMERTCLDTIGAIDQVVFIEGNEGKEALEEEKEELGELEEEKEELEELGELEEEGLEEEEEERANSRSYGHLLDPAREMIEASQVKLLHRVRTPRVAGALNSYHVACRTVLRAAEGVIARLADALVVGEGDGEVEEEKGNNEAEEEVKKEERDEDAGAGAGADGRKRANGGGETANSDRLRCGGSVDEALLPRLVWDRVNNAVWFREASGGSRRAGSGAARRSASGLSLSARKERLGLIHPLDRNARPVSDRWSTPELEEALQEYRDACLEMETQIRNELRDLAKRLLASSATLSACSNMALVVTSLDLHAREGLRRGWTVPKMTVDTRRGGVEAAAEEPQFSMTGVWPYWLDRPDGVQNDILLDKLVLLTGPNMAGKSTLLRSVCAVSLLGSAGLCVPAESASLPPLDAIVLRSASRDSPVEGKSAFAVEMREMQQILATLDSRRSLVLIDELCRGTEAGAGAAIAGAFLKRLDSAPTTCTGVFSTHLHKLLEMIDGGLLELHNTKEMRMGIAAVRGPDGQEVLRHTWRLLPGRSTESLAFQVAEDEGIDTDTLELARKLYGSVPPSLSPLPSSVHGRPTASPSGGDSIEPQQSEPPSSTLKAHVRRGVVFKEAMDQLQALTNASAIGIVAAGELPPPSTTGLSIVYVLCTMEAGLYVGQTDGISKRVEQHRKVYGKDLVVCFAIVENGGASSARRIEGQLINILRQRNFAVLNSERDSGYRSLRT